MSGAWLTRLQLLRTCALAALLALSIDAARLDAASDVSMVERVAAMASVPSAPDSAATRAQRDRDLRAAASYIDTVRSDLRATGDYIDSVRVQDYFRLGNIRDILERFENIRERVLCIGAARDPRHRHQIRKILRDVKELGEGLKVLAGRLEAKGEVDDGGDVLPSQRKNICSRISKYRVEPGFLELVHLFCESLNTARKAVIAREDEEPVAYCVSGLLLAMIREPEYRQGNIGLEIERVLGEERRWVAKHLATRPAGAGSASPSPSGTRTRFRRWALRAWETQIWEEFEVDTAALPLKALKDAQDVLLDATVNEDLTLTSVRTRIKRIELCRGNLATYIPRSDSAFRDQIREVFQEMNVRMHALSALAAMKLAAGEVDNSGELLLSQRDNICTKLDAFGLEEDFRDDVWKLCETLDRLRLLKTEVERDRALFEITGRMAAMKRRPDYSDTAVASELENLLAEGWSELEQHGAFVGA